MLLLALSLAIAQAPDLNQKVTYSAVGLPTTKALASLSKATGIAFTASKAMDSDVLVLHMNDVPVVEAMKRIAEVTDGQWQPYQGGYLLARDNAKVQNLQRDALAARTKEVLEAIQKMMKRFDGQRLTSDRAEATAR